MTTGKESSNLFMASSLLKTIHFYDSLLSDEDSFEHIELMILCTNFLTMDASKHGRIDDADAEVTFIDKTSNDARNKNKQDFKQQLEVKKCLDTSSCQMSTRDKSGLGYGDQVHNCILSYENEVFQSVFDSRSGDVEDSPVHDRFANVEGMHAVPPPMTENYIPSGPDREVDDSMFTYGPKQSNTSESDTQTSTYDSCESNSSAETLCLNQL
ncbi:hypothetical protein Tco_0494557 [Tanacetum coccineum]